MPLDRYHKTRFTRWTDPAVAKPVARDVFQLVRPAAPAVIVLHELFGLSKSAVALGDHLADHEPPFSVYLPVLFGRPEAGPFSNAVRAFCVRRQFEFFRTGRTSPITSWLRFLAQHASGESGGKTVGLIGMCLTGGLVFAAVAEPLVGAGVASQPSLPMGLLGRLSPQRVKRDLGLSPADLATSVAGNTPMMKLRYRNDRICPEARIETAAAAFGGVGEYQTDDIDDRVQAATGDRMTVVQIAGAKHSVLTQDLNERARDLVVEFLRSHLGSD